MILIVCYIICFQRFTYYNSCIIYYNLITTLIYWFMVPLFIWYF